MARLAPTTEQKDLLTFERQLPFDRVPGLPVLTTWQCSPRPVTDRQLGRLRRAAPGSTPSHEIAPLSSRNATLCFKRPSWDGELYVYRPSSFVKRMVRTLGRATETPRRRVR